MLTRSALAVSLLAGFVPLPPDESKPTKEQVAIKIREFRDLLPHSSAAHFEERVREFRKLGAGERLQRLMVELYPEVKADERVAILHVIKYLGVEHARPLLPRAAQDFAAARATHPNEMSFAAFYVLDKFQDLAWRKLPREDEQGREKEEAKKQDQQRGPPRPDPARVSPDGVVSAGLPADRGAILKIVAEKKLNQSEGRRPIAYPLPPDHDTDWIRIIDGHAFVRLRGESSGVDLLFMRTPKGEWTFLCTLGAWLN
jgi:hypothetical protein